jgi:hypothetical protein
MVCKRDWSVDRGGGSPMTRTGPADAVLPACRHAPAGRSVLTRPGPRDSRGLAPIRLVCVCSSTAWSSTAWSSTARPATGVPAIVRAVFPGGEPFKPVPGWLPARPSRLCPAGLLTRPRPAEAPRPPCSGSPPHPLYLYLLKRPAVALSGCLFDPGRDMLCILTSPPRWLQWP